MNGRDLLEAMSFLDEELIAQAEPKPRSFRWQWAAALAACFCAVLLGSLCLNTLQGTKSDHMESVQFALPGEADSSDMLYDEGNGRNETACAAVVSDTRIRVEELTEDGFRGIALEDSADWSEGTTLLVIFSESEALIPGEEYRIQVETFDPETLRVTISRIEPENAD